MSDFIKYMLIRALKTFCQTLIAIVPVTVITEVNWPEALGTAFLAAILSICTSVVTGLPEAESKGVSE